LTGVFPFVSLIEAVTGGCLDLIRYMGSWNFAAVPIPSFPPVLLITFYTGIIFYAVSTQGGTMRRHGSSRRKIMIAARPLHVTFLDVGQGDGAVAELPDGRVMVIDTGKNGFQVASFLKYRGCRKIDLLVLSHAHPDHCDGLPLLEKNFRIGEIWDNGYMPYRESVHAGTIRRALNRGDAVRTVSYAISVFHPYKGFYSSLPEGQIDNDYSAVLKLEGGKHSFLFTGDISEDAERDIAHIGSRLKSTVLKVPDHGSRSSLNKGFLHLVSPEIAVISAGKRNMFRHPHGDTLAAYSKSRV
jgi:competence protein ComEC